MEKFTFMNNSASESFSFNVTIYVTINCTGRLRRKMKKKKEMTWKSDNKTFNQKKKITIPSPFSDPLFPLIIFIQSFIVHYAYSQNTSQHPCSFWHLLQPLGGCLWHDDRPWGCGGAAVYSKVYLINNKSVECVSLWILCFPLMFVFWQNSAAQKSSWNIICFWVNQLISVLSSAV